MSLKTPPTPVSAMDRQLASDKLSATGLMMFVLTAATPLTVVAGVATTAFATTGLIGFPIAFVIIGILLALFGIGYLAMSRQISHTGAFYAYIAAGIGRPVGVAASWIALAAYTALQVGLYGLVGVSAQPLVQQWFGVEPAWWVLALVCWAVVAVLGRQSIDINGRVLAVLLTVEAAIILIATIVNLANPAGGTVSMAALDPGQLFGQGTGALLVLAFLAYIGFEAVTVYSRETRDERRTMPRALYGSLAVLMVLYVPAIWSLTVAVGPESIVAASQEQDIGLMFNLLAANVGAAVADTGAILLVTSVIAAAISFHNTVARYAFALGREGVLPVALGRTSVRGAPMNASIAQSVVGLTVIVCYAVFGLDPLVDLFFYGGTSGALGILILIAATSVAVTIYFIRHRQASSAEGMWRTRIAPQASILAMGTVLVLALVNFGDLLGTPPGSALPYVIPIGYAVLAIGGLAYGQWLARRRPHVYAAIGQGARATLVTSTSHHDKETS